MYDCHCRNKFDLYFQEKNINVLKSTVFHQPIIEVVVSQAMRTLLENNTGHKKVPCAGVRITSAYFGLLNTNLKSKKESWDT